LGDRQNLESQKDSAGAAAAYRRAADAGHADSAFALGRTLYAMADASGAHTAFVRARELGLADADSLIEALEREAHESGPPFHARDVSDLLQTIYGAVTEIARPRSVLRKAGSPARLPAIRGFLRGNS
jgi:hypothetical protein